MLLLFHMGCILLRPHKLGDFVVSTIIMPHSKFLESDDTLHLSQPRLSVGMGTAC